MTREEVLKLFPDATDEQVTNLLNKTNSELAAEKSKANKLREKAERADQLQKDLDDLNDKNLSDIDKATKDLERANQRIAELERNDAIRTQRTLAMEQFKVTAEQAKQIVKDDGTMDYTVLGQIIADKEKAAVDNYEKKALDGTPNPGGGSGKDDNKSTAEKLVAKIRFGGDKKSENDVLSHYLN